MAVGILARLTAWRLTHLAVGVAALTALATHLAALTAGASLLAHLRFAGAGQRAHRECTTDAADQTAQQADSRNESDYLAAKRRLFRSIHARSGFCLKRRIRLAIAHAIAQTIRRAIGVLRILLRVFLRIFLRILLSRTVLLPLPVRRIVGGI